MKKTLLPIGLLAVICAALFAQSGEDLAILYRMMRLKMDGLIPLRFANALDAKPVEGARVIVVRYCRICFQPLKSERSNCDQRKPQSHSVPL